MKTKTGFGVIWIIILTIIEAFFSNSYCQKFKLTNINSTEYSIDRIAQQVYFKDFFTDTVRRLSLNSMNIEKTNKLVLLPFFANKHHFILFSNNTNYGDSNNSICLYNLDNKSYYQITDTLKFIAGSEYYGSFSPNDSNFIFPGLYFALSDSSLNPLKINVSVDYQTNDAWPQWSSDSSFVFLSFEKTIAEYFLKSKRIDTLVTGNTRISGFAYNIRHKILAYSKYENYPGIYFHCQDKQIDTLVFGTIRDDSSSLCWREPITLEALCWSPDESKLAFLYRHLTNPITGIYVYNIDSSKIYHGTNCSDGDVKYHLTWANNDTLIYDNESEKMLYGIDVSNIYTSVEIIKRNIGPNKFIISNYPNPFNPSTLIHYEMPKDGFITLKVYDILGNLVKTLVNQYQPKGRYDINFNSGNLASGVYLYRLQSGNFISTKKMLLLK